MCLQDSPIFPRLSLQKWRTERKYRFPVNYGIESNIEGINDLYVNGKKICGILLESGSEFDSSNLQWVVAGIGINFDSDISRFPDDVKERASSLFDTGKATITKNMLIARIVEKIS